MGGQEGSSIALYHPVHFSDEHDTLDKAFRETCCSAGLCDVFHERRPIDTSIDYEPPFFGEQDTTSLILCCYLHTLCKLE